MSYRLLPLLFAFGCVHADRTVASLDDERARIASLTRTPAPETLAVAEETEALDRRAMVAAYLAASPEFAVADAETDEAIAEIDRAASVEAPELMVQAWNIPFRRPWALDDASMWMAIVEQRFEPRGVRRDRVRERSALAREALAERAARAFEVAALAVSDHAELVRLDASIAARAETLRELDELADATRALVAGGRISVRDVAEIEASRTRLHAELAIDTHRRAALARVANTRMDRPADSPLAVDASDERIDPTPLRARLETHPALAAIDARIEAADASVDAARHAARRPAIATGVGVFEEPDMGFGYGLSIRITLPFLGGRADAEHRIALARRAAAEASRGASDRTLRVELESAIATLETAYVAIASIDESILPSLERAARAETLGLASGSSSITRVLLAETRLAEVRIERADRLGEVLVAESAIYALAATLDAEVSP